ncbi:MAG: dTMP kinase [Deferribacteraceae bacterium]|jgi:dTMP kinase|nr:dTMP kinase [Deferribacteraceae bacterium]
MRRAAAKGTIRRESLPRFIVIDGIDGTGKTTQTALLVAYLKENGVKAVSTYEPGGTASGREIRRILLNKRTTLSKEAELLLFSADRSEHQIKISELLNSGVWVISDRFLSSTWAYQVCGRGAPAALLEAVLPYTVKYYPNLTIILDLDTENALQRSISRLETEGKAAEEGRFEAEKTAFFQKTREGFLEYAAAARYGETVVINAAKSEKEIAAEIAEAVRARFF